MPKTTLYHVTGGVGLLSTFVALLIAFILQPDLGAFIGYAAPALVIALIAWAIGGILRLRLVGILPSKSNDDDFIPRALQPWIRFWLLARFGLLAAVLALLLVAILAAIFGQGANHGLEAFVYIIWVRMIFDMGFGAALNFGIIARRRSAD